MISVLLTIGLVLLVQCLAFFVFRRFAAKEVTVNADMIKANGAADDLKAGFHERRTWIRFWPWLACTLVPALVGLLSETDRLRIVLFTFAAFGALLGAYFLRVFNPGLNLALHLDYKTEYYASPVSVSFPDAFIYRIARKKYPNDAAKTAVFAASVNHKFLNICLWLGILSYIVLMIFACN